MRNVKLKAKAILLDLDGTIVDSRGAYLEALRTAFVALGQKVVDINIVTEIPKRLEQGLPIDDLLVGIDAERFLEIYLKAYYQATAEKTKPFPNVEETVKKLAEKAKLALSTRRNVPRKVVVEELERLGLARYFPVVMTSQDTSNPKPAPEALMRCASLLGVKASECVVVGDSVVDVRAGKNAGAKTVAVLSGIFSLQELEKEKPDLIIKSVKELPDFLE